MKTLPDALGYLSQARIRSQWGPSADRYGVRKFPAPAERTGDDEIECLSSEALRGELQLASAHGTQGGIKSALVPLSSIPGGFRVTQHKDGRHGQIIRDRSERALLSDLQRGFG